MSKQATSTAKQGGSRSNVVVFEPPVDRSLEGYKAWVRGLGRRIAGKELERDMSEADWEKSWRVYWGYREAGIQGVGTDRVIQ